MNCNCASKYLTDYIEGELPPAESASIRAHVDTCPACREEVARLIACRDKLEQTLQFAARKMVPPAGALAAIEEKAGITQGADIKIRKPQHVLAGVALSFLMAVLTLGSFLSFIVGAMLPPPDAPVISGDGSGGVYLYWRTEDREFEQHIDASGSELWGDGGREITGGSPSFDIVGEQHTGFRPGLSEELSDSTGNIRLWYEDYILYAQKIDDNRAVLWETQVYGNPSFATMYYSNFVSDGAGGVIIASRAGEDESISNTHSVYAQRISADGQRLWGDSGIEVQKVPSSPAVLYIAGVSLLVIGLVVFGLYRKNKVAKIFTPIISVVSFFTGMYCLMLLNFNFGQNAFEWDYILNTPPNEVAIFIIFAAGLALAVLGIKKARITKWIMVPIFVPYALIAVLFVMLAVFRYFPFNQS